VVRCPPACLPIFLAAVPRRCRRRRRRRPSSVVRRPSSVVEFAASVPEIGDRWPGPVGRSFGRRRRRWAVVPVRIPAGGAPESKSGVAALVTFPAAVQPSGTVASSVARARAATLPSRGLRMSRCRVCIRACRYMWYTEVPALSQSVRPSAPARGIVCVMLVRVCPRSSCPLPSLRRRGGGQGALLSNGGEGSVTSSPARGLWN
jgi:hypothetical protein